MAAKNDATGNMVEIRRANGRACVSSTKFPKLLGVVRGLDIERFGIGGRGVVEDYFSECHFYDSEMA
jgi:hypothetical protein